MRPVFYTATFMAVIALAFWAYRENYATQRALRDVTELQRDIATLREALSIQHAEWAYLNRPDRLRELVTLNFDRLGLFPMEPAQFGSAAQIAMPPPPIAADLAISDPVDVIGDLEATEGNTP